MCIMNLFQNNLMHTKLDIYVFIAKFKIQIENVRINSLFWRPNFSSKKD